MNTPGKQNQKLSNYILENPQVTAPNEAIEMTSQEPFKKK